MRTPHLRFQPVATDDLSVRLAELVAAGPVRHAPDFGGPEILSIGDLNRVRARVTGKRARLLPLPVAGFLKAFDQGAQLAPDHLSGTETWEAWLSRTFGCAPTVGARPSGGALRWPVQN